MRAADQAPPCLDELAEACGVTSCYHDGTGQPRRASAEALVAVLAALGAPLAHVDDAPAALREVRARAAQAALAPVLCATLGHRAVLPLGPLALEAGTRAWLTLECGRQRELSILREGLHDALPDHLPDHEHAASTVIDARGDDLPAGYHTLSVENGSRREQALVLAAPARLPRPARRSWALFAPLHALHSRRTREIADYQELGRFARLAAGAGADYAATLPLLDIFADIPFDPSPYAPISRRFWSELYVDVDAADEPAGAAATNLAAPHQTLEVRAHGEPAIAREQGRPRIDYRAAAAAQRRRLEARLAALERTGNRRLEAFEQALAGDRALADYASFRAGVEKQGRSWRHWPAPAREGRLAADDFDHAAMRVHAYAQWLAREQIERASRTGAPLYLDFPLGSHADGYDTWRDRQSFALGIGVGAPPDGLFTGGQNWGFPPLHPERQRRSGYALLRAALRHHFDVAGLLRIDHVMGLHRLFWIAEGCSAADGVYVRYPADEMWSVVAIEAARAGAGVVGEDLGTVPDGVRAEMERRGALGMFVVPFELRGHCDPVLPEPPPVLACLGTHDTATFAAWWEDLGEDRRRLLGFLRARGLLDQEADGRELAPQSVLEALLAWLAASDAAALVVSLEDLLLEREPQNRPGTASWDGNWSGRAAASVEDLEADACLLALLAKLTRARRDGEGRS